MSFREIQGNFIWQQSREIRREQSGKHWTQTKRLSTTRKDKTKLQNELFFSFLSRVDMFAAYSKKDDSNLDQSSSSKTEEGWLKNASFGVAQSSFSSSQLADTSGNEHTSNSKKTQQSQDEYSKSKDHNKQKMKSDGIKKKKKKKKKDEKDSNKTNITASVKLKADSREHCKNIKTEFSNKSVRKSVFSNGMHLRHDEAFFEDLKGDRDNFAFPNMYFKNVARSVNS